MVFAPARLSMKASVAGSSGPATTRVLEGADMGTSYLLLQKRLRILVRTFFAPADRNPSRGADEAIE